MEFQDRLKNLRKDNKYTQGDVASKLGVSQSAVYNWERGIRKPKIEQLLLLAQLFNVTVEDLLGDSEIKSSDKNGKSKIVIKKNGQIKTFDISKVVEAINKQAQKDTKTFTKTFYNNEDKRSKLICDMLSTHNYTIKSKDIHWLTITNYQGGSFLVSRNDFANMIERCDKDICYNIEKLLSESRELKE